MLKLEQDYYVWIKSDKEPLNQFFNTSEFTCQCKYDDCQEQKIAKNLIDKLEGLRKDINVPIKVTSGFRCTKHQQDLRNSLINTVVAKKSTHELGHAVDIIAKNMSIPDFLIKCEKYFLSIGIAKTFLHVDLRSDKKRRWDY